MSAVARAEEEPMDDPVIAEAEMKSAIISLWSREAGLNSFERTKLKALLLNLKAVWLASRPPVAPPVDVAEP